MLYQLLTVFFFQLFAWLPWFKLTILDPLRRNHFIFDSATHIKNLTYPMMILHAEDDPTIPVKFGRKVKLYCLIMDK